MDLVRESCESFDRELHSVDCNGVFALGSKLSRCYDCLEATCHVATATGSERDMIGGNLGAYIDDMLLRVRSMKGPASNWG